MEAAPVPKMLRPPPRTAARLPDTWLSLNISIFTLGAKFVQMPPPSLPTALFPLICEPSSMLRVNDLSLSKMPPPLCAALLLLMVEPPIIEISVRRESTKTPPPLFVVASLPSICDFSFMVSCCQALPRM